MARSKDLTGQKLGMLMVLSRAGTTATVQKRALWNCLCDCGKTKIVTNHHLMKKGTTPSCGCRLGSPTHGMSNTRLFVKWEGMKSRCKRRPDYAGKGVYVCERWLSFENFFADMGADYSVELEIDRIDNSGPYSPENCRWVTKTENIRNRSCSRKVVLDGVETTLWEACQITGVNYSTAGKRWTAGRTQETGLFHVGKLPGALRLPCRPGGEDHLMHASHGERC